MKSQYEDKMQLLQHQIKSVESERDRVLKDISKLDGKIYRHLHGCVCVDTQRAQEKNDEKTKEIKLKYERQLAQLRAELRSMNSARKEHAKAMKKNVSKMKFIEGSKYGQWTLQFLRLQAAGPNILSVLLLFLFLTCFIFPF